MANVVLKHLIVKSSLSLFSLSTAYMIRSLNTPNKRLGSNNEANKTVIATGIIRNFDSTPGRYFFLGIAIIRWRIADTAVFVFSL